MQAQLRTKLKELRDGGCSRRYSRSRMTMNKQFLAASPAMILALGLQGCASTSIPTPETTTSRAISPAAKSVPISDLATVENLLRWPLEGPAGVVKTGAELRRAFPDFEQLRPADFHRRGPMQLEDGYVLSFAWIRGASESLSIGLESEPCFSPARAAEISGGVLSPVFRDSHGVDRGKHYDAEGNGVRIRFTTTPDTYRCVDSIQVHSVQKVGE